MTMDMIKQKSAPVLIGLGLLYFTSCSSNDDKGGAIANTDSPVLVTLGTPSASGQDGINVSGQVEASETANISTRVMGYITKLTVKVGDHVNKGQLIATISNQDILAKRAQAEAAIAEAEAALKNAQKDEERFTALYNQQSATAKELENMTLQYNAAKSRVESAKQMRNEVNAMLAYTSLTAPFTGMVTQKWMDAGSMANPGMPIITIEEKGSYQVSASVPESEIGQVKKADRVDVRIQSLDRSFKGTISQINPSSQFTGGQYIIKISIPEKEKEGLYAGMYANVSIASAITPKSSTDAVLVPVSSIVRRDQLTGLYTVSGNNTALLRWVRLGKTIGDQVEVKTGLAKTESFIASTDGKLYNGAPIKLK
ncbi:MAG: efflux RND transporter periplasmic adaptor subunit [Bacteroidetes bacterium]|nr:efflux RND transporter periplasmic adaptor subunit [Bacteroidota bacterium]